MKEFSSIKKKKGEEMKRIAAFIFVFLSLSIMSAAGSYAGDYPCKNDIARFCGNIEPGDGRILKCLTLNEKDLTPPCKKNLARIEEAVGEVQKACADDYAIFCSSVVPGQGRIAECLEKSKKNLTPRCKAILGEVRQKAQEIQEQMKK